MLDQRGVAISENLAVARRSVRLAGHARAPIFPRMSDAKGWDDALNAMILSGKGFPDGYEKFYADDVVMLEGGSSSYASKEINRRRELEFASGIERFHGLKLLSSAVQGDVGFC